jgi:hypothetical protein
MKPEGRTARVATRKIDRDAIARGMKWEGRVVELTCLLGEVEDDGKT